MEGQLHLHDPLLLVVAGGRDCVEGALEDRDRRGVEVAEPDLGDVGARHTVQELEGRLDHDLGAELLREPEDPARDRRQADATDRLLLAQRERVADAGVQLEGLVAVPAVPDRPDRVDHELDALALEPVGASEDGLAVRELAVFGGDIIAFLLNRAGKGKVNGKERMGRGYFPAAE